jgi:hypothetical protein
LLSSLGRRARISAKVIFCGRLDIRPIIPPIEPAAGIAYVAPFPNLLKRANCLSMRFCLRLTQLYLWQKHVFRFTPF